MAMNLDMTYCEGNGCMLSSTCRRYTEGRRIAENTKGDTDQHWFMGNCDPETRELYIGTIV